ncbi:MAG TPA: type II toxin-antitoxin system HicA family toxin [Rhodocyclaceae bacterium]|nr:type II toxin-antitoxin system HicA family toxin [Rhodocyclaceae bacterium]
MSHKHQNLLRAIFQDPVSGNIHWREVESLLVHLGAQIEPTQGARFRVLLNRVEGTLHHPHQGNICTKQDIKHLREYLGHAGVSPSSYEALRDKSRDTAAEGKR